MLFETTTGLLAYSFAGAAVMGAVAHKTNFCTMGSVSDWINMGNTARLGSWFFSIAVAIFGVMLLEGLYSIPLDSTLPPYRTSGFAWLRYLLGGLMFGIGMTLAGGCGSKTLINIGGGSLRSLFVLLVAGIMAYLMTKTAFYEKVFHSWISATTINLANADIQSQSLADIASGMLGIQSMALDWITGLLAGGLFLFMALRSKQFRKNTPLIIGGGIIGVVIVFGWYISGGSSGQQLIESIEWLEERPLGVGVQSYTFINPMGETLGWLMNPGNSLLITFGMAALLGVIAGSMIYALVSRTFRITRFSSWQDFFRHLAGGLLMGTGGVLAMGCTIGQGITGSSTLALGSFLALGSIIFGSAITIKTGYYRMAYDDATFTAALISSLVDFRLLPESLRKLEAP
ncbi:MAG: uncharacterized protein QG652_1602 [Pseudomonadota bacterium]|nr:uncharacterized protein [Pseudomonadota bacterium]